MTYAAVDTAYRAARASGDLTGKILTASLKKAAVRSGQITAANDQREWGICQSVLDGTQPATWVLAVMIVLDLGGNLASPTDAQVDTAVDTAWAYFVATRR